MEAVADDLSYERAGGAEQLQVVVLLERAGGAEQMPAAVLLSAQAHEQELSPQQSVELKALSLVQLSG